MLQISVETPEIKDFIEKQAKAGRFSSAAEVIEAGVAGLMVDPVDDELDEGDLAAIEESELDIERGEDLDWNCRRSIWESERLTGLWWASKPPYYAGHSLAGFGGTDSDLRRFQPQFLDGRRTT